MLVFSVQLCVLSLLASLNKCWPQVLEATISELTLIPCKQSDIFDTTNETSVVAFWIKSLTLNGAGYMVHPTAPTINFGAVSLAQSSVDPSIFNSTATAQYVTYRGYFWVAFVFRRVSPYQYDSNCILDKVVYDLVPTSTSSAVVTNVALSNMLGVLNHVYTYINNPHDIQIPAATGTFRFFGYTDYYRTLGTRTAFKFQLTDSDWSDQTFVRALRYGLTQSIMQGFNFDAPGNYFEYKTNGSSITREQVAYARRDGYNKIGLPMYVGSTFSVTKTWGPNPGFMSVIHIYGAAKLLQTAGAVVTFTQSATISTISGTLVQVIADVVLSNNGIGGLVIQLQNVAWRFYMTNGSNPYIATNQASAQIGTLTAAMVTRYMKVVIMTSLQYSGNGASQPDSFIGLGWTWVSVMADVAETQMQNVVKRTEVWAKSAFNIVSANYTNTYFEILSMTTECKFSSTNPSNGDYNVTFFNQDHFSGFPDWETLLPGFNYNTTYAGNCYRQMPTAYMDVNSSCPLFRHTFVSSTWACPFSWVATDYLPCVHCNTGYYPDVTQYRNVQPYESCKSKSECIAQSNSGFVYINKYEGTAYDYRGMCEACPPNCKTCDANLTCIECLSPVMNTASPRCDCFVAGCDTCLTTTCDLCPYYVYLNYDNRTQIRTCENSCKQYFGLNTSYVYGTASGAASFKCVRCYHQNCTDCTSDYMVCNSYCAAGTSLVDYNFALPPDKITTVYCRPISTIVAGYVYDPATHYFTLCEANCSQCLATNTSQCLSCSIGSVYLVDRKACLVLSACPNGTYTEAGNSTRCKDCIPNCTYCVDGSVSCQQCTAGMMFHADQSRCIPLINCGIGSGSFVSSGVCRSCIPDCANCTNSSFCEECSGAKYLSASKTSCMNSCPAGENPLPSSHSCSLCLGQCATCTANTSYCLTCRPGFYLNEDHTCGDCSQQGYGLAGSVCRSCSIKDCMSCTYNPDECTECKSQFILREGACLPCTAPMFVYVNSKCLTCDVEKCSRCVNSSTTCESCESGYTLQDSKCSKDNKYEASLTDYSNIPSAVYSRYAGKSLMFLLAIAMLVIAPSYAISLIKVYQMMEFMQLYSLAYPENFQRFLLIFQASNPIDFSFQKLFNQPSQTSCPDMDTMILEKGFDCQFVTNATPSLTVVACWIILMLVLKIASKFLNGVSTKNAEGKDQLGLTTNTVKDKPPTSEDEIVITKDVHSEHASFKNRVIQWVRERSTAVCSMKAVYFLAQLLDIDIMLAAVLNIRYYPSDVSTNIFSIVNKVVSGVIIVSYPLLIVVFLSRTKSALQNPEGPNSCFLKGRHLKSRYQIYREVISMFRNYAACVLIVCLYKLPFFQIGIITAMFLGFASVDIYYKSYIATYDNIVTGILNVLYTIASCVFLVAKIMEPNTSSNTRNNSFGYPLIVLFSGIIVVTLFMAVYSVYQWSKKKLKINKFLGLSINQVVPVVSTTEATAADGVSKGTPKKRGNTKLYSTITPSADINNVEINSSDNTTLKKPIGDINVLPPKSTLSRVVNRLNSHETTPLTLPENLAKPMPARFAPKRLTSKKKPTASINPDAGPESERMPIMMDSDKNRKT